MCLELDAVYTYIKVKFDFGYFQLFVSMANVVIKNPLFFLHTQCRPKNYIYIDFIND